MKKTIFMIVTCVVFLSACKGNNTIDDIIPKKQDTVTRVVAYLPTWKMPYTPDWKKITHLCIAFGLVNSDGSLNLTEVNKHRSVINIAQNNGVKVLLSIGGGGTKNFSQAILNDENRTLLVDNLQKVVNNMNLDGIDVDYEEWDGGPEGASTADLNKRTALEMLYKELREVLGKDKLITAAVTGSWDNGGWGYYNCYNNTMHKYLDFVSLMIYDETGPWSSSNVGPHSSWTFFENSIRHWLDNRKLPKEKLVAGVPFYGYKFQSKNSSDGCISMSYQEILTEYPADNSELKDSIGLLYYDGMLTIEKKTQYIKDNQLGGIMFWEITGDTDIQDKSLLNVINRVLKNN